MQERFSPRLSAYLSVVTVTGAGVGVLMCLGIPHGLDSLSLPIVLVLSAAVVLGELWPLPVPRGDSVGDEISVSTTLVMAMVMTMPPGFALAAQTIALVADEARGRRAWRRLLFNIGQYALAIGAARLIYNTLLHAPTLHSGAVLSPTVVPAWFLASTAFFVVNHGLTGTAVALKLGVPVRLSLLEDFRWELPTSAVLLALAPLVALAAASAPWMLPLIFLPLLGIHRTARLAFQREHEALHDPLTGLANRALLQSRLVRACRAAKQEPFALVLLDIDHFKEINDTLGHQAGDLLLVETAYRLRGAARGSDTVARIGGDEFAVLMPEPGNHEALTSLAHRLRRSLDEPVVLNGVLLDVSVSVGVVAASGEDPDPEALLHRADIALYAAKADRGSVATYDADRDAHPIEHLVLLRQLRDSLTDGSLFLVYQPKFSVHHGHMLGVEALARWNHPRLGLLTPDSFIPLAESTRLIGPLTNHLLEIAVEQLARWRKHGHALSMAVNLSPRVLTEELAASVSALLDKHEIPHDALTLEVTEGMLTRDPHMLDGLRGRGVRLSIDDFGTGYASLSYLRRLAVDEVKIDRTFVKRLGSDPHDEMIVRTAVDLGHHFGLSVVAEGVEDELAMAKLRQLGCDEAQGFFLSQPMLGAEIETRLVPPAPIDLRDPADRLNEAV